MTADFDVNVFVMKVNKMGEFPVNRRVFIIKQNRMKI